MCKVKILLYCTKGKPYLWQERDENNNKLNNFLTSNIFGKIVNFLNGKIVAECECEKVEEIICNKISNGVGFDAIYDTCELLANELHKKSCLDDWHLVHYFGVKDNQPVGYALHLSNVKVFDKPLSFQTDYIYKHYKSNELITKAPQNMCNVYDRFGNHYILISIQPQHLVNILNGKKTIEIRKSILNLLKETM